MVLAAVREDRMPGGRNSGAVYNLYKVKYRKHKKPANGTTTNATTNALNSNHVINTTTTTTTGILKSALTCPRSESFVSSRVAYNSVVTSATTSSTTAMTTSSSVSTTSSIMPFFKALMTRDPVMSREESDQLLNALIECDDFQDFGFVFKILKTIFVLFTI
jgi:nuclear receptor subfamily 6 group A